MIVVPSRMGRLKCPHLKRVADLQFRVVHKANIQVNLHSQDERFSIVPSGTDGPALASLPNTKVLGYFHHVPSGQDG
jgi:hypothetical protein